MNVLTHKRTFYHIGYTTSANVYEMAYDLQNNLLEQFEYTYGSMLLSTENFWKV